MLDTSYKLLLERLFIHMPGVMPSTLHQLMKFVSKEKELCIHGERSHSNGYHLIVDEVSRGCDFYMVKLVNIIVDDLDSQPPMPYV